MHSDLDRFLSAQEGSYATALAEISSGKKRSHWMWFIFPQVTGLGHSEMSRRYAIRDREEAQRYLEHPILGKRLIEISRALLQHRQQSATAIFGRPDDLKLHSSMTLFASLPGADQVFRQVLDQFFIGKPDLSTLGILGAGNS